MPKQTGAIIDATAAADPELDPPGVKSLLCGFVVNPGALCPSSVDTVFPIKIHPDCFATATEAASLIGTLF